MQMDLKLEPKFIKSENDTQRFVKYLKNDLKNGKRQNDVWKKDV